MQLSHAQAQALMLAATGLHQAPSHIATKKDLHACIRLMAVLQIDTIHVVARSPYLVLWSRLGSYNQAWLGELLEEGRIFEYWSHEASFLPIEDYPIYRSLMLHGLTRSWKYSQDWLRENAALVEHLLDHIRSHGEVRSSDFVRTDGQKGTWWNWKAEKHALEMLYSSGELMIARRHHFQRIYNLRERVLPSWDDQRTPTLDQAYRSLALMAVKALGVTNAGWVADYFRTKKTNTTRLVEQLADEGALLCAQVEGWSQPAFIHPDNWELAHQAANGQLRPTLTTLLSPFDPLVWDRARALAMFNFDYRIECYTPAPKRRYGYFTLPILRRGALVGRLDPKAHRREGIFEIKALHLEPGVEPDEALAEDIAIALRTCARWHATPEVVVRACDPPAFQLLVEQALSRGEA